MYSEAAVGPEGCGLCVCAYVCVSACLCVCAYVCVPVCVRVRVGVCTLCACAFLLRACLHSCLDFSYCITTECSANAIPTVQSCGGKPRFASSAWLPLFLALLCLSLSPVRSCLLQAGGVWGVRGRQSEGGHPLRSSLQTINNVHYRPKRSP